jgi:hypothetical protein
MPINLLHHLTLSKVIGLHLKRCGRSKDTRTMRNADHEHRLLLSFDKEEVSVREVCRVGCPRLPELAEALEAAAGLILSPSVLEQYSHAFRTLRNERYEPVTYSRIGALFNVDLRTA